MSWLAKAQGRERVTLGWTTRLAPEWTFDFDAIRAAADELGVRWPIRVGCAEYANGRWAGMHSCERDGGPHVIRVGRRLSPESASRTLWHELRHAEQTERLGAERFGRMYRDAGGRKGAGYERNEYEHEARAAEARASERPLVRA